MHDCCHHGILLVQISTICCWCLKDNTQKSLCQANWQCHIFQFLLPTLSVDPSSLFASTVPLFQMMSGNKTAEQDCADEMGDDAAQTPRSVADKADNSADGSIIEIFNHTVDTVLYLPVCRDWQIICAVS